ncbi:hypothetical protein ADUPG1_010717 [Aduncisulcus paluster]|uniref:Uncharacterized protein n=1 Tax=Aduncisulcus paluster TaxID=2918883 RepID=A0ABQ5JWK9_9EUKA|nr:hypothetical protein ADUPG1_010717 [Aduncisulcus paluster]
MQVLKFATNNLCFRASDEYIGTYLKTSYFPDLDIDYCSFSPQLTCMCDPVPTFTNNQVCNNVKGNIWAVECAYDYYFNYNTETCDKDDTGTCAKCPDKHKQCEKKGDSVSCGTCRESYSETFDCRLSLHASEALIVFIVLVCIVVVVILVASLTHCFNERKCCFVHRMYDKLYKGEGDLSLESASIEGISRKDKKRRKKARRSFTSEQSELLSSLFDVTEKSDQSLLTDSSYSE